MSLHNCLGNSRHLVWVSPHIDDALLSCFGFFQKMQKQGWKITVLSVFTEGSDRVLSDEAAWMLRIRGFCDSRSYFLQRKSEDYALSQKLGYSIIHFAFTDALFRLSKIGKVLPHVLLRNQACEYPHFQEIFNSSESDQQLKSKIRDAFKKSINAISDNCVIVGCPIGIGLHVDHVLTREILELVVDSEKLVYYEDYPYSEEFELADGEGDDKPVQYSHTLLEYQPNHRYKQAILQRYTTEFAAIFPHYRLPKHVERIWVPDKLKNYFR